MREAYDRSDESSIVRAVGRLDAPRRTAIIAMTAARMRDGSSRRHPPMGCRQRYAQNSRPQAPRVRVGLSARPSAREACRLRCLESRRPTSPRITRARSAIPSRNSTQLGTRAGASCLAAMMTMTTLITSVSTRADASCLAAGSSVPSRSATVSTRAGASCLAAHRQRSVRSYLVSTRAGASCLAAGLLSGTAGW